MNMHSVRIVLFSLLAIIHVGARYGAIDLLGDVTKIALMPCLAFCLELHKRSENRMLWGGRIFLMAGGHFPHSRSCFIFSRRRWGLLDRTTVLLQANDGKV